MAEQPLETDNTEGDLPHEQEEMFKPTDVPKKNTPKQSSDGNEPILLRDYYLLDMTTPLPEFDSPSAKSYLAQDPNDLGLKLFVLICSPKIPTRLESVTKQRALASIGCLDVVEWDLVYWPPLEQCTMAIIFKQPLGGRIDIRLARKEVIISDYDAPKKLVGPLANIIERLDAQDAPHRAIRPENMFFNDEQMNEIVMGENLSTPPGYDQPSIYEPIERAMSDLAGRGVGSTRDDIYALGVTIGVLMLGKNPVIRIKEEDLIQARLEYGSYAVIFGNSRIPLPLIEPLQGMLNDDPEARWDFNEISNWIDGQRTTPSKKIYLDRAENPFVFQGKEYFSPRSLAYGFSKNISDSVKTAQGQVFDTWLRRSLGNKEMSDTIKEVFDNAKFHPNGYQGSKEYISFSLCMILDPLGPIHYKNLTFMPDGFGPLLGIKFLSNSNFQFATTFLAHDIGPTWLTNQSPPFLGASDLQKNFSVLKGFIEIKEPGYGLERVLYEINIGQPCHSPLIANDYVLEIEGLLPAMERASSIADTNQIPIDRHIAAFIAARFKHDIYPHLKAFGSKSHGTSIIGLLSLLAFLQWKLQEQKMLGLSSWIGGLLGPAINIYHNRKTRRKLEKEIPQLVRKGSLPELFDLVDNANRRNEDLLGYKKAKYEWETAEEEVRDIEGGGDVRIMKAEKAGQHTVGIFSIIIALTFLSAMLIIKTW
jgi:serine/threonine protein kinase